MKDPILSRLVAGISNEGVSLFSLSITGYDDAFIRLANNEDKSNNGNGNGSNGGNNGNSSNGNPGNGSNGNGNSGSNGNGNGNSNSNSGKGLDGNDNNNGQGQEKHGGIGNNGNANEKGNNGKHNGWYKNAQNPHYVDPETGEEVQVGDGTEDGGYDLTNPENFQVTNYINDLSLENEEVLMTTDVDGNYRGVYTYDNTGEDLISEQDLGKVEGTPNDPLYYVKDAIGSVTAITNMNGEIIDTNRFASYGEALDPVAKNARLTNSPFGYTGEIHDIEGGLVYLRARYYEPDTMRFIQQDTELGETQDPLSRNLYAYAKDNPLTYVDPSGNYSIYPGSYYDRIPVITFKPSDKAKWKVDKEIEISATCNYSKSLSISVTRGVLNINRSYNKQKINLNFTPQVAGDYIVQVKADGDWSRIAIKKLKVKEEARKKYLTLQQLKKLGWSKIHCGYIVTSTGKNSPLDDMTSEISRKYRAINQGDVDRINTLFKKYKINTKKRIAAFFAECSAETGSGKKLLEAAGTDDYPFVGPATRANLNKWFNKYKKYGSKYRGAGAIQLIWDYQYKDFEKWMKKEFKKVDSNITNKGAEYVAFNYTWEAAVYFWTVNKLNSKADTGDIYKVTNVVNPGMTEAEKLLRKDKYDLWMENYDLPK